MLLPSESLNHPISFSVYVCLCFCMFSFFLFLKPHLHHVPEACKSNFLPFFPVYNFACMCSFACMCVCAQGISIRSPGTGLLASCELLRGCWELNLGPLQKQYMLLTNIRAIFPAQNFFFLRHGLPMYPAAKF